MSEQTIPAGADALPMTTGAWAMRVFAWFMVAATFVYLINNWLMFWLDWPGMRSLVTGEFSALGLVQGLFYVAAAVLVILYVQSSGLTLRQDSERMTGIATFLIRAAFWSVFLIGLADAIISFLRVEEMLGGLVGQETADSWNYNSSRAPDVHLPLAGLAIVIAAFTRSLMVSNRPRRAWSSRASR